MISFLLYGVCSFAAIGGFLFGYDSGVISGVLTMTDFKIKMNGTENLSSLEQGTITGLLLAGCFVGSLVAGNIYSGKCFIVYLKLYIFRTFR